MFLVSVVFAVILVGTMLAFAGRFALAPFLLFWGVWMATFLTYILIESVRSAHHVKRIRADTESAEPNDAPLRLALNALAVGYRDWVFRSRATLLGYPLIDINVGNPAAPSGTGGPGSPPAGRRIARGWIAIGDDARGLLVGMGGIARGLIAIGGIAIGGVAIGGCSLGALAIGGLALGWQAWGGVALAWHFAVGGLALAWYAALGGAAVAHDYAVGGAAWARFANDNTARAVVLDHPLLRGRFAPKTPPEVSKVERFQLLNGLSVILRPVPGAKQTALMVLYSLGGDHDPQGRSGLAHLVEHVYVTAAAGAEKARGVDEYVKQYPAGWNAQTGDRYTVIAAVFPAKDVEQELRKAAGAWATSA